MVGIRIYEKIVRSPDCSLEELIFAFPDYSWNQIFFHVDALSRSGAIRMRSEGLGRYRLLPTFDHAVTIN